MNARPRALTRIIYAILPFLIMSPAHAGNTCPLQLGNEAEIQMDDIRSWDDFYGFFQKYKNCDDGGIAEGLSDKAATILTKKWSSINRLEILTRNKEFESFVLHHVNVLMSPEQADTISKFAHRECPANYSSLCLKIIDQLKFKD